MTTPTENPNDEEVAIETSTEHLEAARALDAESEEDENRGLLATALAEMSVE